MPNPLDTLYDQLKGQYPDLVDRSEFIGKLSDEGELKKLHDAASKDIPGFVDFDNFKSKVDESLSTYDKDSDYKAQSAPAEQESAPTDITIPRREKGRHVPQKPQNGGVESETNVPVQPGQPVDTHVDAEAFDRETGDLDELGRRYEDKIKRLGLYGITEGLYINEDEARKHYEAYSRLYDEAEQDRLVYNRRVKAAEDERAEQQRQLDLQSKDRKTRRSAEYGGYTNDQVRKEQERLKKERAYLEDPKSRRNADYSKRVMEYNADQTALSGEADKRNKRAESKRAMYDEVKKVAEDPDVQRRITGNDTVTYVLSGNNPYALQNYDAARERAKTMTDEELVEHCKAIAGQKYARGDNKDVYAPLAAYFLAYHNELMYRLGGDEPKSALEARYDMIDKVTEGSPEGDEFMVTLRNYLDGTSGMGTANFENDQRERANIPQFAIVDEYNRLVAQKEAENMRKVEQIGRYPQQEGVTDLNMAAAATDINYDAILEQAFEKFGDANLKAYIAAHALRNGISIDESARRVNQSIWNETLGKTQEQYRPKSGFEFFVRRIFSDNMFSKLGQIGLRARNGTLGSNDPFMMSSMALDEYAKDHPVWDTAAVVTNFAVLEGPIFSGYGKLATGLVGAGERALIGAVTKTADKMAIDSTVRALSQSLIYRLAKGMPIGGLVGFQYGTMSGAIDQAYYDGNVNFGKVIANGGHMTRDFAIMHGVGELFGVTGDAILRRGQRNLRNGQGVLRNRFETTSLHFLNNVAKTTTNAGIVTGLYAAIDRPALERENKKIAAENARLPEDQRKPLNQIASVEDTFYSSLRMFAGLDAVGMLRSAWSIGVRGEYERNKHVRVHFDKFDREALEKAFGKNPNSLLRQIVFGNVDGIPAKWFEIDPEAEQEIYKELGRELTPAEKEAYATYGLTELRKVILNKDIPWATRAKIVSVITGQIVQEPPVAKGDIKFEMDSSGTQIKRIIVRSLDLEGNVIQDREFSGKEFEAARRLYESLNDRGWRNNAMLCGDLVIDAIEDKTYADTVDEMAREKGISSDQFEKMVFGIKQKDITGEKVTYQERQLVDEFDKRHQEKQKAEMELSRPSKLFEQVAREVFGDKWKRAYGIPEKSWGEMTQEEKEFVGRYIDRMGAMGVAERNKLMNTNPDWARTAKEYEESVRRRMAEAERPAEAEPLPALEDEKVSVETPAEERVEPVPEVIELEEEKPAEPEPVKEEAPAAEEPVAEEKPDTEGQPQAGTIGFEPVEQPTERERFDAERKAKAATITDADIEANREALGIPEGTALTDEARQIYAEDLAEDLMRYERFKRGESDEKARFHDYWENKFNPKRPKLERPVEKQEEPVEEEPELEVTETDALLEQLDNLKGRSDLEKYRHAMTVFAGDDEIMAILEDLEPHDITEWVSSFLGLDSGKGYSMLWESKTRNGSVIAKGFKEETGWNWNDAKGFAFMFDNKNGLSPRRVAEKIWDELPAGMKDQYSDVDVFNIMMDLFKSSSRKSDLTNYIRNNRLNQVRELLTNRRNEELDAIARDKERVRQGEEESVAEPVTPDESSNEFATKEDDVAPFSLLSLNYRGVKVEGGTIRSRARTRKQIGTIAKALGYKIRWVADKSYNAKIDTDEKVLYLNIRTDMPLEAVIGHEITHDLRKSDPKAYETLKRYAMDLLGQAQWDSEVKDVTEDYNKEYKRRGWEPIRVDKAEEEVVCDAMGKLLHSRKGLRELAGSLDTSVAGKVYRLMKDIADKVKTALGKEHDYSPMDSALQEFLESVEQRAKMDMPIKDAPVEEESSIEFSLRRKPAPKKTGVGYKVFFLKDGKLYPPMVANIGGEATPFGVWLDADAAPIAGKSKTGRNKVKAGGKGTQGGSGTLAYRPGWHLGKIPYALQFNRGKKVPNPLGILNKKGQVIEVGEFFPNDFVWAEVEYAADKDYQEEAHGYGVNANGKYNPSLAGLPRVPEDGSYEYRTNPNPATDPWIITGAMKVNKILKPSEVDEMVRAAGREPQKRQEGAFTDEQIDALNKQLNSQTTDETVHPIQGLDGYTEQDVLDGVRGDIENKLNEAGVDGVTIKGMALHGSRMRGDARADSDLDVVVEYEGDISEDGLFNILNDEPMYFDGVKVDINPITRGKSGTLEQYMERSHRYDEEQLRDESTQSGTSFSLKREGRDEDKAPTFYSNAAKAVENVKQNKATAEQWKAMLTKAGGIKAGEDKWMGLSQWLDEHKGDTLTKDEVRQFVRDNGIQMEEVRYQEGLSDAQIQKMKEFQDEYDQIISDYEAMYDKLDDEYNDFTMEMYEKYGDGWEYEMTPGERADEDRMLNERQKYASQSEIWGLALDEMVDRYGDDFQQGFYNDGTGDLEVSRDMSGNIDDAALYFLGNENENPINSTRLDYTTDGLENKREIAFAVPGVEPYQENDEIHFGPENQGRAIMWVRFGETTDTDGNRVLVIDEIQSNRHQDAREKGYRDKDIPKIKEEIAKLRPRYDELQRKLNGEGVTDAEHEEYYRLDVEIWKLRQQMSEMLDSGSKMLAVPAAPFEKNWHEVAMKRMLRLAAEEGFDKVAWTTGEQQAERYDIGGLIDHISVYAHTDPTTGERIEGEYEVFPVVRSGNSMMAMGEEPYSGLLTAEQVNQIYGKDLGSRIIEMADNSKTGEEVTISGEGLRLGGEGMKGFYDQILPRFMDKYGKKWGVKTGTVELDLPNEGDRIMHSIDVTPEMKESVMQGQPLFSLKRDKERTLMGVHNITAEKLRSALKLGGLANPSMAVVNTNVGGFDNFGEISLIPGSDLIASRSGRNAGTWGADAYSPRFPETHRRLGKGGDKKMRAWVKGLGMRQEMEYNTEEQFNDYYNGFNISDNALVYPFLYEKGLSGEVDYYTHMNVDQRLEDDLREANGDQFVLLKRFDEDEEYKKKLTDIVIGDEIGKIRKKDGETFQQFRDRRREWAKEIRETLTDEDGFINRNLADDLLYPQARAYRENGKFNESYTHTAAEKYIRDHGMQDEYQQYFEQKMQELGAETQVYAGSDSQGRSKFKPIDLESVSKQMKKQGRAGGEGGIFADSPGAIRAKLLTPMKTLDQIRKEKGRIVNHEQFEQAREEYQDRLRDYADTYANGSIGALADILTSRDMVETAKQYNRNLDAGDLYDLNEFKDYVRKLPTEYFETKFERPVGLEEFKKAVVPDNLPLDLYGALQRAGIEIVEYPAGDREARQRVTLEAVRGDQDVMFSLMGRRGATRLDDADHGDRMERNVIAEEMEKAGKDARTIKLATGWERGADGKWRYEIMDFDDVDVIGNMEWLERHPEAKRLRELIHKINANLFGMGEPLTQTEQAEYDAINEKWHGVLRFDKPFKNPDRLTLQDYVKADELFAAYPELREMPVKFEELDGETRGVYRPGKKEIAINVKYRYSKDGLRNELLHEVQHAIQDIEGFAPGSSEQLVKSALDNIKGVNKTINRLADSLGYQDWIKTLTPEKLNAADDLRRKGRWFNLMYVFAKDNFKDSDTRDKFIKKLDEANDVIAENKQVTGDGLTVYQAYRASAGEVEARNVQSRSNMNREERRVSLAENTEDIPRNKQTVRFTSRTSDSQSRNKIETRTDTYGNEVYTETREDGTKDREMTTFKDGSKSAMWFDKDGILKERLDYYPNGEVSQVANFDNRGNLTRHIQYDENRRITSYYLPAIGTDWRIDENGVISGKSNGVEIKPYNFQFSLKRRTADLDKEYVDAIKRGDEQRAVEMLLNKLQNTEGIVGYVAPHGYSGSHADIAKRLKTNEGNAVVRAVADMQRFIPDNAVLVPMPPHDGKVTEETDTMILADALSVITGKPVVVALEGEPRESRYAAKAAGRPGITAEEMGFEKVADIPEGKVAIIIDNVVGSGETAKAAVNALGGGITLAYAKATRGKVTEGLKNATITYDDKGNLIPLSQRFDLSKDDVRYSLKRRRNRDDYTDEDRADAAIIANTYLAQADALRQQIEADRQREHQLVEERNRLLAFDYPAADPADRPAIMDRINALRNQINDLRNANYENNTKLRSMDYEYRVAKEILEQGAVTDEEAARFDAGQMTREEKVLESLFKAAADSRADKKAKQKAIRGLVRELVAITDNFKAAMKARGIESQCKHYDKGTVDHIIRLARAMMGTGYIDNMTSYEVKRLMGMINNAATRESIEEQAGRIVDMMLDHQIRTLRNDFSKQLKVTGQKTNSSGVQVQAGLDQEGQVIMEAMRKSMQIIADSAGERYDNNGYLTEWGEFYEKTLNDMGDADPVKAEQARKIFEGVWLASKWYEDVRAMEINGRILRSQMEDFKASNKPAKDADADTKQRYNDVLADYQEMLRQNKIKIIEAYERMTGDVGLTQADSMRRAKEFADAQKQRVEEIQHNANSDLADVDDNTQVKTPESRVFGANKNNVLARLLFASAGTYEKFMRFFGRMAPNGEGYLFKRFMTQYHNARQDYWKGRHSAFEEMDRKMAEVFGKKKMHWSDIYEMTRDHKKFPPIMVSYWDGYRNGQPYVRMDELNQSEALYLYMINKMPDGRMKLRHMGITDDVVQQMADQIDNKLLYLADWLQSEFLPKMRIKYNETHKRVFGADMAAIEDYFPLRINKLAVASDMDITERDMNDNKPSTITGAIVKRRVNTLPIDLHTDAFDVALSHIDEMEHWSAFAEFNRDNNTLVNYKRFRTKVNNMRSLELGAGDVLWKNFTDAVAIAADAYHPRAGSRSGDHYSTRVAKFVTTAKLSLRQYTALKQLTSIPAFWADSAPLEQFKATVDVVNTWQWAIENLPGFAERWQSRQAGNIKLANYNDLSGLRRRKTMRKLQRAGMWANAAIDGLACAMGGKAVYETKLKRYRKMGYDEARAQEKALIDAAIAYNNSQQSSEGAYVSPLQVDRTWFANAFSVFRSASMGYTRRLNTSLRQLRNATFKPGYGANSVEFLKKQMMRDGLTEEQATKWAHRIYRRANLKAAASVAIFGQILPFTWNLSANMFYLLFGNDDKEKERILADSFRHSFFGPVEGLTGGNVISELSDIAADTAIGNIWGDGIWGDSEAYKALGYRDFTTMPLSSDLSNLLKYFARDEVKAANEVVNILFQVATGVNPQTITDWATAILDFGRSDMERRDIAMFVMRMLSTPQSQLDKFYLDQMNITQEQADKMSVDDLIKRYATYKRWRETPLTGWMYSDEREKKVEEKFQKRYEQMLEERSVAEDGLRSAINDIKDLPRKRTMMQKLQKELTDSIEAADPELYKKALEGEKADDDEYVRHVTDKDVEQMAELAMKKKALLEAHDRKTKADQDAEAGRITKEEYDAIYKECAHQWKLYNYLNNTLPKKLKEWKLKMEPDMQDKYTPEQIMDTIRSKTDKALQMRPEDMKLKKGDKKKVKKNKKK